MDAADCSARARAGTRLFLITFCIATGLVFLTCTHPLAAQDRADPDRAAFEGTWQLMQDRSTSVDPWRRLALDIQVESDRVTLHRIWSGNREAGTYVDSTTVRTDGTPARIAMGQWPDNRHLGAFLAGDSTKHVTARWLDDGRTLRMQTRLHVRTSQGTRPIRIYSEYRLSPDQTRLTLLELRSTRPRPLHYTFRRTPEEERASSVQ